MNTPYQPARIHLLPAKEAPVVIVVRRKPTKTFLVLKWNTETDAVETGSWFNGRLFPLRSDVSFDGKWMIYLAMGSKGETWSGLCAPPWLKTTNDWVGSWDGGGFWDRSNRLLLNGWPSRWRKGPDRYPFSFAPLASQVAGEESVLYPRLARDGWVRNGPNHGQRVDVKNSKRYQVRCIGDDGWKHQLTSKHPTLRMKYVGYFEHGHEFHFSIDEHPELLSKNVTWATWDHSGNLVFAESGRIVKYSLADIGKGKPTFEMDLEPLQNLRRGFTRRDGIKAT